MGLLPLSDFYHMDCYGLQLLNRDQEVAPTRTYPSPRDSLLTSAAIGFYHRDCYELQLLNRDREVAPTGAYSSRTGFSMGLLPLWDFYRAP